MRHLIAILVVVAATASCTRNLDSPAAGSPTAPSAVAGPRTTNLVHGDIGSAPGKFDLDFPPRSDLFTFTINLNGKYQGMGRTATMFIDLEGIAVWTQEYIRYRVNGCDHATASARVMTQIGGGAAGGICSEPPSGAVAFPPRSDPYAFIVQANALYQQMGRGVTQLAVDLEGATIWIQEYLYFRLNFCDAAIAQQKVFSEIDGGPVPATCFVSCSYRLTPSGLDTGASTVTSSIEIRPTAEFSDPRSCGWTATSDQSWLTVPSGSASGNGFAQIPYSIQQNNGGDRVGRITVSWQGGSATFTVFQIGTPFVVNISMTDPARAGTAETSECHIRSSNTTCFFTAAANLPGGGYTYNWEATYEYAGLNRATQQGGSNQFSISDNCGDTGSSAEGTPSTLTIRLTITDDRGNTVTVERQFGLKLFTC